MYKIRICNRYWKAKCSKSTLLNHIIGEKISIISNKPKLLGIKFSWYTLEEECQIVFLDTPGIQRPKIN